MELLWWCVTEVEVGPHLVSAERRQTCGGILGCSLHAASSSIPSLSPRKRKEKEKSSICLTLLPPPPPTSTRTTCAGSGAGLLGGPTGSRGGIELWLQLLSVVIGVSVLCGARLCPPSPPPPPSQPQPASSGGPPAQQEPDHKTLSHSSLSQKHPGFLSYVFLWQFHCSWLKARWNRRGLGGGARWRRGGSRVLHFVLINCYNSIFPLQAPHIEQGAALLINTPRVLEERGVILRRALREAYGR